MRCVSMRELMDLNNKFDLGNWEGSGAWSFKPLWQKWWLYPNRNREIRKPSIGLFVLFSFLLVCNFRKWYVVFEVSVEHLDRNVINTFWKAYCWSLSFLQNLYCHLFNFSLCLVLPSQFVLSYYLACLEFWVKSQKHVSQICFYLFFTHFFCLFMGFFFFFPFHSMETQKQNKICQNKKETKNKTEKRSNTKTNQKINLILNIWSWKFLC